MMHYRKGENIEQETKKEDLPFEDCMPKGQSDFLWMHVKGGTKVSNVVDYAKKALDDGKFRTVVWSGSGGGLVKTVSCAEIIKRTHPLYQVTKMCHTNIEEHWLPQMEGLDELVVNRQVPCLHILMSLDAIDDSIEGLQKPNTKTIFYREPEPPNAANHQNKRNHHGNRNAAGGSQNQRNQNRRQDKNTPNRPRQQNEAQGSSEQSAQETPSSSTASHAPQRKNNRRYKPKSTPNTHQKETVAKSENPKSQQKHEPMES